MEFLDFKKAECKNCYKCLRECPVKAIDIKDGQAKIIEDRCILCGKCTLVCPQNAKKVHSELNYILNLLKNHKCIASVAPSFVSSFAVQDFSVVKIALGKLGFYDAEETSVGAMAVTNEYEKLLINKSYKNLITSCCPAVNNLIQLYYPAALQYLARVDSPMVAHAKMIKKAHKDCKVIFIGPCISKKKEALDSGIVDGVLTFEELDYMLKGKDIDLSEAIYFTENNKSVNRAKFFPISRGIIKSFDEYIDGYEYMSVDGMGRCIEALEDIENLSGVFLEINACEFACVNGPCSLEKKGGALKANADIRAYVQKDLLKKDGEKLIPKNEGISIEHNYLKMKKGGAPITEKEIREILIQTGKTEKSKELNCGACGYATCREKAWAVANGYADIEMCLPYMRERAESMSYEIIQSTPNGIVVMDYDLKIMQINNKAKELYKITDDNVIGKDLVDYIDPTDYLISMSNNRNTHNIRIKIDKTDSYIDLSVILLTTHKVMFGVMKDVTQKVKFNEKFGDIKESTLKTTEEVIHKQMRVVQEIASLLGETTAETKIALLKLKNTMTMSEEME